MAELEQHAETIVVRGAEANRGERGEILLVRGQKMSMRKWEGEPAGTSKPEHVNDYEYVAYVVDGLIRVTIDGNTAEVGPGDSYCVPAGSRYSLDVVETATVVEAVCPR